MEGVTGGTTTERACGVAADQLHRHISALSANPPAEMLRQGDRAEAAGTIEPAQREGLAGKEANTARFRGFHLKADPYRWPQRGPVTDANLPRGLRGRRVS